MSTTLAIDRLSGFLHFSITRSSVLPNVANEPRARSAMIAQAVGRVGSICGLGRRFFVTSNDLDIVFCTPVLQGALSALGLECVPLVKATLRREEFFESA